MNPTQIFKFVKNRINQKLIKFNRVQLGQNRSRPRRTVHEPFIAQGRAVTVRPHGPTGGPGAGRPLRL
jgi:hypothetical protein